MNSKENLPLKEVILLLGAVIYVVAGLAVTQLYSKPIGLLMLSPILAFLIYAVIKMPKEDSVNIEKKLKEQKKTFYGKYGFLVLILVITTIIIINRVLL